MDRNPQTRLTFFTLSNKMPFYIMGHFCPLGFFCLGFELFFLSLTRTRTCNRNRTRTISQNLFFIQITECNRCIRSHAKCTFWIAVNRIPFDIKSYCILNTNEWPYLHLENLKRKHDEEKLIALKARFGTFSENKTANVHSARCARMCGLSCGSSRMRSGKSFLLLETR